MQDALDSFLSRMLQPDYETKSFGFVTPEQLARSNELTQIFEDIAAEGQVEVERVVEEMRREYQIRIDIAVNIPKEALHKEIEDALNVPEDMRQWTPKIRKKTGEYLIDIGKERPTLDSHD
jgi:hypothetical protein